MGAGVGVAAVPGPAGNRAGFINYVLAVLLVGALVLWKMQLIKLAELVVVVLVVALLGHGWAKIDTGINPNTQYYLKRIATEMSRWNSSDDFQLINSVAVFYTVCIFTRAFSSFYIRLCDKRLNASKRFSARTLNCNPSMSDGIYDCWF